jgi:hypothetical protein
MHFEHFPSRKKFSRESKLPDLSAKSGNFYVVKLFNFSHLDCVAGVESYELSIEHSLY